MIWLVVISIGPAVMLLCASGIAWTQLAVAVDPQHCCIAVPQAAGPAQSVAAEELHQHLGLITAAKIPIAGARQPRVEGRWAQLST